MILVTGSTGNVGASLIRQLAGANQQARALVRSRAEGALPPGVETVIGDLSRPESLSAALIGVRGVFLLGGYQDMPGTLAEIRRAGVERVVLLSSRSVVGGNPSNAIVDMWMASEEAVRSSGVSWTILRPSGFMSNALRWAPQIRAGAVVRAPFADVPIAVIDPCDIAAVAAVALTFEGHTSRSYILTGPKPLLPADQVRALAAALGKDLRFERQADDEAREEMSKSFPANFVDAFFRFFAEGEFDDSQVLPTVHEITGRQPRAFEQWARAHVDAFR
ncbi:MAG TPA: NAD(P)H-binding protein [Blastocatellia bacterium]|nr:NAD(P)H-binding protein [Blastocatellia bacterium]